MFLCKETNVLDPLGGDEDVFGIYSVKENLLKRYESPLLTKGYNYGGTELDGNNDFWTLAVFLTPPCSPNHSPDHTITESGRDQRIFSNICDSLSEDDAVFKPRSTKDLKSMLIRDCMWNGETTSRTSKCEKLRPITKTPPLVDCNLRVTHVDPSEIWPFHLSEQIKVTKKINEEEVKSSGNEASDEDVEVDVVSLEGAQKVPEKKKETLERDNKTCASVQCETQPSQCSANEKPTSPLTPNASDDEYSCKLRSGVKRRRISCTGAERENCIERKIRVSSGDESDQDCEVGRATHNVLERKRRNELKQRFQYLRDSIPELSGNDRAPKVAILQKAFSYITYLKAEEKKLIEETKKQRLLKDQLLNRVLELQNQNLHSVVF